jgi:hypothetical protein
MQVERRAPPVVAGRLWLPAASPSPLTLGNVGLGGSGATLVPSLEGGVLAAGGARPPPQRVCCIIVTTASKPPAGRFRSREGIL